MTDDLLGSPNAAATTQQTATAPQGFVQPRDVARQDTSPGFGVNDVLALANTAANEAGAGLGDKFAAAADALVGNPQTWFGGETIPGDTWWDRYRNQVLHYQQQHAQEAAAHPALSAAANVGGAVLNPLNRLGPAGWFVSGALHGAGNTDPNAGWGETAANAGLGGVTDLVTGKVIDTIASPLANALLATPEQKAILSTVRSAYPVVRPAASAVAKAGGTGALALGLHHLGVPDWMLEAAGIGGVGHLAKSVYSDLAKAYANAAARRGALESAVTAAREPVPPPTPTTWTMERGPGGQYTRRVFAAPPPPPPPSVPLHFPGQRVGLVGGVGGQQAANAVTPTPLFRHAASGGPPATDDLLGSPSP